MDQWKSQAAIIFLSERMSKVELSKPAIIHGIRAGLIAEQWGVEEDAILSSYLHDILEDTDTTYEEIIGIFGKNVADAVRANTKFDTDGEKKDIGQMIDSCLAVGKTAIVAKAADIIDNIRNYKRYHRQEKWDRERESLERKRNVFLEKCVTCSDRNFYKDMESVILSS
jgi:guanosine-3',5'-bis(diphosphate) 3'-pyrophosphohydrolase